jgi:hypothetical protein
MLAKKGHSRCADAATIALCDCEAYIHLRDFTMPLIVAASSRVDVHQKAVTAMQTARITIRTRLATEQPSQEVAGTTQCWIECASSRAYPWTVLMYSSWRHGASPRQLQPLRSYYITTAEPRAKRDRLSVQVP